MSDASDEKLAEAPPTWAVVHLMGHARYAGKLTEEEKFGCKLGRVDTPNDDGTFTTVYFGGSSVYKIEVVTEAVARTVGRLATPQPVSPWDFPKQLPVAASVPICADCGCDQDECGCNDEDDFEPDYS